MWLAAVYKGAKPQFPNYSLFSINGNSKEQFKNKLNKAMKYAPRKPSFAKRVARENP